MNSSLVSFSSFISRDDFQSGILSDQARIDLKAYFVAVKTRYETGEEFPYDLEELVPTVFASKQKALEALEKDFTQDIDYRVNNLTVDDATAFGGYRNTNNYRLSPLAFEFMVARKNKDVFSLYHTIFHAKTGSYSIDSRPAIIPETLYAWKAVAEYYGLSGNQAILSAERAVTTRLGFSPMQEIGITHIIANETGRVYTPTDLGQLMTPPLSAVKFNLLLESADLQKKELGSWLPTDEAEGLFEWADTGKKHSNGTPVKQLRWFKTVLNHLQARPLQQAA